MELIDLINELAVHIQKPSKVIMGKRIYDLFKKQFFPITDLENQYEELIAINTLNGRLDIVVIDEDSIKVM